MSGKNEKTTVNNPLIWIFRASLLILGAVIALNLAVAYLRPIMPWLIGGFALASTVWIVIAIIRWRRSRW
jgi:hypothetical protein